MKLDKKALKTVAEILEVLRRNGYETDSGYAIENFMQDYGSSEVIAKILVGDGPDYDAYGKIPLPKRLAQYSQLPPEKG